MCFHIFDKLGVSSRMEAVVYSFNHMEAPERFPRGVRSAVKMSSHFGDDAIAVNE